MSENDHVDVFNGDIRKSIQALEYPKFSTSSDNIEKSPFSIVNALFAAPNIQHAETIQRDDTHMIHGLMWMNYPSKTASEACTTGTSDVHALVALATASDLCSLSDVVGANYSLLGIEDTLLCSLMPQVCKNRGARKTRIQPRLEFSPVYLGGLMRSERFKRLTSSAVDLLSLKKCKFI